MKEFLSVVTRKGQITLPAEIRRSLQIKEGDKVAFSLEDSESPHVVVRLVRSVAERTFGIVKPRKRPEDFEELREIFEEEMARQAMVDTSTASEG